MGRVKRPRFAAEEPFGKIGGVPQVKVADLRTFNTDDAKEMSGRNVKSARFARRHDYLADFRHARSRVIVGGRAEAGQPVKFIDDYGLDCPTLSGVGWRRRRLGIAAEASRRMTGRQRLAPIHAHLVVRRALCYEFLQSAA